MKITTATIVLLSILLVATNLWWLDGAIDAASIPALQLTISDQGIGIPEEELDIIFDKFVQSSRSSIEYGGNRLQYVQTDIDVLMVLLP